MCDLSFFWLCIRFLVGLDFGVELNLCQMFLTLVYYGEKGNWCLVEEIAINLALGHLINLDGNE